MDNKMDNKQAINKVLEEVRSELDSAYQASSNSRVDNYIMRAYGRIDTLIKLIRES